MQISMLRAEGCAVVAAAAIAVAIWLRRKQASAASDSGADGYHDVREPSTCLVDFGSSGHDVRRKSCLSTAKAVDLTGRVKIVQGPDFDLDKTIFKPVTGILREKLARSFGDRSGTWSWSCS